MIFEPINGRIKKAILNIENCKEKIDEMLNR